MADMRDMKPYSRKITSASSGAHMVAKASRMASQVHKRSSSGTKLVAPNAKKFGRTAK